MTKTTKRLIVIDALFLVAIFVVASIYQGRYEFSELSALYPGFGFMVITATLIIKLSSPSSKSNQPHELRDTAVLIVVIALVLGTLAKLTLF